MAVNVFNNVNGFNLKVPYNSMIGTKDEFDTVIGDNNPSREWIEFTKKPNELPTVKLRTMVLYYRDNAQNTIWDSSLGQSIPTTPDIINGDISGGNYRFYNDDDDVGVVGAQMGSIWGFPLFDLSGSAATHWPRFKSCIDRAVDISGNQKMLVDLAEQRNIIVLDCSGLGADIFNDISNNIPELTNAFYITLRIKSSTESVIPYTADHGKGTDSCWNLYENTTLDNKRWATLVQYEYECDIIGPKGMLDLTLDYFMYNVGHHGFTIKHLTQKLIRFNHTVSNIQLTENKYNGEIMYFLTGCGNHVEQRMEISQILKNLSYYKEVSRKPMLDYKTTSSVVKLIGGWCKYNDLNNTGYYGSIGNTALTDSSYNETEGWKNDIFLKNTGSTNVWSDDLSTSKSYDLNNILWCSLRSPRRIKVRYHGSAPDNVSMLHNRWIKNFIYTDGDDKSNDIIGGGYGRYSNTIDLPRASSKPYYSSTVNANTVSIENFKLNTPNYLNASPTALGINDVKGFRVYYKLLIPPIAGEEYNISYKFGKDISSVTTFFRYPDMSGTLIEKNNLYANRKTETIKLKWDKSSVDYYGNIHTQSIFFTDIASGFNKNSATFDISTGPLSDASRNEISYREDFDISFNVFQINFLSVNDHSTVEDLSRNEVPYTIKSLDTNTNISQNIKIKYLPVNYTPYRYLNYVYSQHGSSTYNIHEYFFNDIQKPYNISTEELTYDVQKNFVKGPFNYSANATIIVPPNTKTMSPVNIEIPNTDAYSVKTDPTYTLGQEIVIFNGNMNAVTRDPIGINLNAVSGVELNSNITGFVFNKPNTSMLVEFIPDYWRLPEKINTLYSNSPTEYAYLNTWANQIKISMVCDIMSLYLEYESVDGVTKKITHMLVNTNENSKEHMSIDSDGKLGEKRKIIFRVNGWKGLEHNLNVNPIILDLTAIPQGPFGTMDNSMNGVNLPVDGAPKVFFDATLLLPATMRKGNGGPGVNLGPTDMDYNGLFNIEIKGNSASIDQNPAFSNVRMYPSPLTVLLVDISSAVQLNPGQDKMLSDDNNTVTLIWSSFTFSNDSTWNDNLLQKSDIFWTVTRYNISTGKSNTLLDGVPIGVISEKYTYVDSTIRIYDKYNYSVKGEFRWTGITTSVPGAEIPSINVGGFTTADCFICKHNRFPYGRYNTTSTNLKLYRPLLINTPGGQVNRFGNKTCGGGCSDPSSPSLNLFQSGSRISSSNNIYSNVTDQTSKKLTYVILAKSKNRPFR
jgi:hypothetical protein